MSLIGFVTGLLSYWKLKRGGANIIRDWRREDTLREHLRGQSELDRRRIENETQKLMIAHEEAKRQADLEQRRIESARLQHWQQTRTEIAKCLIEHGQASPTESAQFLHSLTNRSEADNGKRLLETDNQE